MRPRSIFPRKDLVVHYLQNFTRSPNQLSEGLCTQLKIGFDLWWATGIELLFATLYAAWPYPAATQRSIFLLNNIDWR
jgi:hypothetical protein